MPWLDALLCSPAGAQHPPAPLAPSPVPQFPREAPCLCTGSAGPGAAQGRMQLLTSCLAPACLRTASSVYRPTRTLCKLEAAAAGRGMRGGGLCDALRSRACGQPEECSLVYPAMASPA